MESTKSQHSSQGTLSAPSSSRDQFDLPDHVEFGIINPKHQTSVKVILDQFAQCPFSFQCSARGPQNVIAVG